MIAALPLSVSAAGEYVPGNPRWSGYQNQVQWGRPAGAASGDSFEYEAQLLLGDDVVESKAVEIDTYLFFTNDVVTRPQEEYTIRVRARWIMIVGDPDGQYMVADVGEAEPPHEHSYTQKHDAAQHWQECSCGERLNVANHIYGDWRETKPATETEAGSRERDCTVCDYVQTETIPMLEHEHSYGDWQKDETQHWKECRCGEKTEVGNHTFGDWTITKEPIEAMELPQIQAFREIPSNRLTESKRPGIINFCRRALFLQAEEINWNAHVWYMERFHIQPERMDPANPVLSISFVEVTHRRNRELLKRYIRYGLGITNLSVGVIRGELIYLRSFLNDIQQPEDSVIFMFGCLAPYITFLNARETNDAWYTAILPVTKSESVLGKCLLIVSVQMFQLLFSIPFAFLRNALNIENNPVGLDATLAWYGFGLIVYAVFDLVFFPAFYKNGYKAGKAFILASIPMVVLMIAVEAVAHIPELSWLDSYQPKYLLMQLPVLVVGIICYTAFLSLAYRISVKYFDKVDL